jgi:hypothetical protein
MQGLTSQLLIKEKQKMIKHVGRHNERKVIIVYREVPEQAHMALVVYSDVLPGAIHDPVMKVLEKEGQSEKLVADAFHKAILPDGRNMLGALHSEGYLKKVQTNQIVVTANATSNVRLDELNKIINEMETGAEAKQRLANLDNSRGLVDPAVGRELGAPPLNVPAPSTAGALTDADIANNLLEQAKVMETNAKSMLEESKRLKAEAKELTPKKTAIKATGVKKTAVKKTVA